MVGVRASSASLAGRFRLVVVVIGNALWFFDDRSTSHDDAAQPGIRLRVSLRIGHRPVLVIVVFDLRVDEVHGRQVERQILVAQVRLVRVGRREVEWRFRGPLTVERVSVRARVIADQRVVRLGRRCDCDLGGGPFLRRD